MTCPWSSTTRVSASRSASSRYWVVSSTVVPPPTSCSITSHRSLRLWGSSPVVGSSRKRTVGRATRAAARSRRRRIPPEYVFSVRSPASARLNCASSSSARPPTDGPAQVVEVADHLEVLPAGQVLVHGRVLAGQSDQAPDQAGLFGHVVPEHPGATAVGPQDGGQDPHRGGLPRSVGPEQAEHGALGDGEADPVEGAHLELALEGLLELFGFDRVLHAGAILSGRWGLARSGAATGGRSCDRPVLRPGWRLRPGGGARATGCPQPATHSPQPLTGANA